MKHKFNLIVFSGLLILNFLPVLALASSHQSAPTTPAPGLRGAAQKLETIGPRIGQKKQIEDVIGGIIQAALGIVGVVFLALTVYGGYLWMLARGSEEQAKKALEIIKMAVIGLVVVLAAYTITYFVVARLTGATTTL